MSDEVTFDVLCVGNALVDVLAHEDDEFVDRHGLRYGAATMVDAETSGRVYDAMSPTTEISGGSAANTAAGVASLGGSVAFVGKVADDQLGEVFTHDLCSLGVHFDTPPHGGGAPTGRCLVVVGSRAERTLCTYLGAAELLDAGDLPEALTAASRVTYLEGYLWDQPPAKEAIRHAAHAAHQAGNRVALTLSDPFCVDRHREEFRGLVEEHVDVLFANEMEICSLYEVDDFDDALREVRERCEVAALTRSERGSVVVAGDDVHVVEAAPVSEIEDVTGAGDLYAAGFLYGLTHGHDLATCGELGSLAAAEVITHLGARPRVSLRTLAEPLLAAST